MIIAIAIDSILIRIAIDNTHGYYQLHRQQQRHRQEATQVRRPGVSDAITPRPREGSTGTFFRERVNL